MPRPADLPDYGNPPLVEVVLGIQFAPIEGYKQINAGEVWNLYKKDFPNVSEQLPLPQTFETFGVPQAGNAILGLGLVTEASHDRFWFISKDGHELIQFQNDRFLHNWRKLDNEKNVYPRFEKMIENFQKEYIKLERFFRKFSSEGIKINQCELSYINHIKPDDKNKDVDDWINFFHLKKLDAEDFFFTSRKPIKDKKGNPYARLICEAKTAINKKQEIFTRLTLSVKGAPTDSSISSSINFFKTSRKIIVNCFDDITTSQAHKKWKKKK